MSNVENTISYLENLNREWIGAQEYIIKIVPTPTGPSIRLSHPCKEKGVRGYNINGSNKDLIVIDPSEPSKQNLRTFLVTEEELEETSLLSKMVTVLDGKELPNDSSYVKHDSSSDKALGMDGEHRLPDSDKVF